MVASIYSSERIGNDDCADWLRAPRRGPLSSGYRNVYWHRKDFYGRDIWVAKVKRAGVLHALPGSRSPDPRACARHVAAWYAREFGPRWREVLASRKRNPFLVKRSRALGGYYAAVWVMGRREEVVRLDRVRRDRWRRRPDDVLVCYSKQQAKEQIRLYLDRLYGLFGEALLWREGQPDSAGIARAA